MCDYIAQFYAQNNGKLCVINGAERNMIFWPSDEFTACHFYPQSNLSRLHTRRKNINCTAHPEAIIVRSPDIDVFVLLIYYSDFMNGTLLFDTGAGNKWRLIAVNDTAACVVRDVCNALLGFHAFTGCDFTRAFVCKGKKRPYSLMKSNRLYVDTMQNLGNSTEHATQNVQLGLQLCVPVATWPAEVCLCQVWITKCSRRQECQKWNLPVMLRR